MVQGFRVWGSRGLGFRVYRMKHVAPGLGFAPLHSTNLPNIDLRKDKLWNSQCGAPET